MERLTTNLSSVDSLMDDWHDMASSRSVAIVDQAPAAEESEDVASTSPDPTRVTHTAARVLEQQTTPAAKLRLSAAEDIQADTTTGSDSSDAPEIDLSDLDRQPTPADEPKLPSAEANPASTSTTPGPNTSTDIVVREDRLITVRKLKLPAAVEGREVTAPTSDVNRIANISSETLGRHTTPLSELRLPAIEEIQAVTTTSSDPSRVAAIGPRDSERQASPLNEPRLPAAAEDPNVNSTGSDPDMVTNIETSEGQLTTLNDGRVALTLEQQAGINLVWAISMGRSDNLEAFQGPEQFRERFRQACSSRPIPSLTQNVRDFLLTLSPSDRPTALEAMPAVFEAWYDQGRIDVAGYNNLDAAAHRLQTDALRNELAQLKRKDGPLFTLISNNVDLIAKRMAQHSNQIAEGNSFVYGSRYLTGMGVAGIVTWCCMETWATGVVAAATTLVTSTTVLPALAPGIIVGLPIMGAGMLMRRSGQRNLDEDNAKYQVAKAALETIQ